MSDTKISGKTTNILNCYFSKQICTLAHQTTYGKLNFPPINSIYFIFLYLEMRRRLIQIKAYYKLFYSIWKETSHKPLKVAAAKKYFPSVYITDTTCFNECFLFHMITGRHYFLYKFIITQRFGTTAMLMLLNPKGPK